MIDTQLEAAQPDDAREEEFDTPDIASATGSKCEHGVYIAKGDEIARYCGVCNPACNRIIAPQRRVPHVTQVEYLVDSADYMDLPIGDRLAASEAYVN